MLDLSNPIIKAAVLIIPLIIAIVFHEVAHGWTARALGDSTAAKMGRLTLNPIKHVDPFGTIIVPGMLMLVGGPVFGWAKPVPVIKGRLRNPRRDMMLVAAAGPGSNLVMAGIGAIVLGLLAPPAMLAARDMQEVVWAFSPYGIAAEFIAAMLLMFILINVFLALFNLLPIPPFDGGHIVEGLLPSRLAAQYAGMHSKALLIMILLIVVLPWISPSLNIVGYLVSPAVGWLNGLYMGLVWNLAGG
ncbi:MAG: site-2 protease family protein [Novosphingobium sp.]|nr:site-2 protease family protein [Novosphingobium sp.]